ncbi:MAG TPA: DNA methyltransferase [Stellaceae bacterium]|nr:DNA methyltransferase [Stellaceae bacterium]
MPNRSPPASPLDPSAGGPQIQNYLTFEWVTPDSLKPYPNNPHKHSKKQIEQVQASIRLFRIARPIIADEEGNIIDGEAVRKAALLEGVTPIPAFRLFGLSETQKRALRIGLNKHPLNADWDVELLRLEIRAILDVDINLDPGVIGMSVGEIDKLLIASETDPDDETIPALASHAISRSGDIWNCGDRHRIGCGDCRELSFLQRVVGPRPIDCYESDPPYNRRITGDATTGRGGVRHPEFAMASGEMSDEVYEKFLGDALSAAAQVSRNGAVHFVFIDHQHVDILLAIGKKVYSERLNLCVWNKSNAGMGGLYRNKHELIGVFKVGDEPYFNAVQLGKHGRNRCNVWDHPSVNTFGGSRRRDLELHPTVKPLGLVADAIMDVTQRGDVVLDGFLGSGTCLLACERTGRLCRGIEINPFYVDLALQRWTERTGVDAILESTGQTFSHVRAERLRGETGNG